MQMNPPLPPPSRGSQMSPASAGSDWSGMNNYNSIGRTGSPFAPHSRDGVSSRESTMSNGPPPLNRTTTAPNFGPPHREGSPSNNLMPMARTNTTPNFGFMPGEGRPRRPSESGSRHSSRAASIANSRSSDGTIADVQSRKYRRMEAELSQHYTVLRNYLRGSAQQPPRPNKARDKLLRLSPVQFHELSTDVFDELQRRQAAAPLPGRAQKVNVPTFLQPRMDFHEKRNQARQKLSSLQTPRFRDLSTDVLCELERRFPHFMLPERGRRDSSRSQSRASSNRVPLTNDYPPRPGQNGFVPPPRTQSSQQNGQPQTRNVSVAGLPQMSHQPAPSNDYSRPMPKTFQSNTITPNKSTMVEDEDEGNALGSRHDRSSDAFGLESAITSTKSDTDSLGKSRSSENQPRHDILQEKLGYLQAELDEKNEKIRQLEANGDNSSKQDMARQLEELQASNKALTEKLAQTGMGETGSENARQLGGDDVWRSKHEQLEKDHKKLQEQLEQQRKVVEEVGRQGQIYLQEMRAMAESGGGSLEKEEKLQAHVQRLEEEVKEWKARYVKAKTQLRTIRASSLGLSIAKLHVGRYAHDDAYFQQDGLVRDAHVTRFQISIDELLRIARSEDPSVVLEHMKAVVLAVRHITSDIDNGANSKDEDVRKKRVKLKGRISATANNLITASKSFAAARGLSPVSLLDAAASHLTAAVVDLIRTVKIRPTPPGELEDDDDGIMDANANMGYFNMGDGLRRRSAVESIYSALSNPQNEQNGKSSLHGAAHSRSGSSYANGNGLGILSGYGVHKRDSHLEELKIYLEDQTDHLVQSIQSLVNAIRTEENMSMIRSDISNIVGVVGNVIEASKDSYEQPSPYQSALRQTLQPTTATLHDCVSKLMQASLESQSHESQSTANEFTQRLPPLAFQIARETKELLQRLEHVDTNNDADEDFS